MLLLIKMSNFLEPENVSKFLSLLTVFMRADDTAKRELAAKTTERCKVIAIEFGEFAKTQLDELKAKQEKPISIGVNGQTFATLDLASRFIDTIATTEKIEVRIGERYAAFTEKDDAKVYIKSKLPQQTPAFTF